MILFVKERTLLASNSNRDPSTLPTRSQASFAAAAYNMVRAMGSGDGVQKLHIQSMTHRRYDFHQSLSWVMGINIACHGCQPVIQIFDCGTFHGGSELIKLLEIRKLGPKTLVLIHQLDTPRIGGIPKKRGGRSDSRVARRSLSWAVPPAFLAETNLPASSCPLPGVGLERKKIAKESG